MRFSSRIKFIPLSRGQFAIVDEEDFEFVNKWKWYFSSKGYAIRFGPRNRKNKRKIFLMHRLLMNNPDGYEVDHANGDKTDNRKSNLRIATRQQNAMNQGKTALNKSGYRGVFWHKKANKWCVQITINKRNVHIGLFKSKLDAAMAYNKAARKYHGKFANLNVFKGEFQ